MIHEILEVTTDIDEPANGGTQQVWGKDTDLGVLPDLEKQIRQIVIDGLESKAREYTLYKGYLNPSMQVNNFIKFLKEQK